MCLGWFFFSFHSVNLIHCFGEVNESNVLSGGMKQICYSQQRCKAMVALLSRRMHECDFYTNYLALIAVGLNSGWRALCRPWRHAASWHFSTFVFFMVVLSLPGSPYYYSAAARGAAPPAAAAAYDRH